MKREMFLLAAFLLFHGFHAPTVLALDKKLTYHSYDRGEGPRRVVAKTTVEYRELSDGRMMINREKKAEDYTDQDEFLLDKEHDLLRWTRACRETDTDFTAEREGDVLTVKGTLKGKDIETEIQLEGKAMHIYPNYTLSKFALSGEYKINFWTLRRDKMDKLPMQAINKGTGTVAVNGEKMEVSKVYYSITPKIRERYYNHNYYFRKSDGAFVKKEENEGQVEELVGEENIQ